MTAGNMNASFQEPGSTLGRPDLLVSAVLHLMSHYMLNRQEDGSCAKLASVIERHLKALADLPNLAPVISATCQQLSEQWAAMIEQAIPARQKTNLFARLAIGSRGR